MGRVAGMDDMFGHVPQAGELNIDEPEVRYPPPIVHTRDTMRAKVQGLLATMRECESGPPWSLRDLYGHRGMWPIYIEWFEKEEEDRFRAEFHAELNRLGLPLENPSFDEAWEAGWFPSKAAVDAHDDDKEV